MSTDNDIELQDMIKTEFDKDEVHNHWNDENYYFCTFRRISSGEIILENANLTFFSLFGKSCNCCGKDVNSFLPKKYAAELKEILDSGVNNRRSYKFIRDFPFSKKSWSITAISFNNIIKMAGRVMNDLSGIISDGRTNDTALSNDGSTDFVGTVIISCENGKLYSHTCSERILEYYPAMNIKHELLRETGSEKGNHLTISSAVNLIKESIDRNTPMTFYDLFAPGKGFEPEILRITVFPVVSEFCKMAAATIRRANPEQLERPHKIGSACCEICSTEGGNICISSMDDSFFELIKNEDAFYDFIFRGDIFSSWEDSHTENRTVHGHGGIVYNVKLVPRSDSSGNKSYILLAEVLSTENYPKKITPNERQVLSLAAKGYTNRYIAHILGKTEGTVKKLLHNGYEKLGISSRVELVKLYGSISADEK